MKCQERRSKVSQMLREDEAIKRANTQWTKFISPFLNSEIRIVKTHQSPKYGTDFLNPFPN